MRILLHACCGPCATYPIERLLLKKYKVTCFFFNPNIHGYQEYVRRYEALRTVCGNYNVELCGFGEYNIFDWFSSVSGNMDERCLSCYKHRIGATVKKAAELGISDFTTTLLISRKQDHEKIRSACESGAEDSGIRFFYEDFRKGWKEHWQITGKLNIYKQQYCGCVFSEKERFEKKSSHGPADTL
ncbi:MAG: epoxyqueuosine reductase QueH [Candidatus Aureabacteria bacterium]|nr:epoxyqueuosine reductase QueH [Candidatus Auribacterota bacterium]